MKDFSKITPKQIEKKLTEVIDPELGIDIVSLGFIYDVSVEPEEIKIKMTLTTSGCPLGSMIQQEMKMALSELVAGQQGKIKIALVFDPPWTPDMMSQKAKDKLGYED